MNAVVAVVFNAVVEVGVIAGVSLLQIVNIMLIWLKGYYLFFFQLHDETTFCASYVSFSFSWALYVTD